MAQRQHVIRNPLVAALLPLLSAGAIFSACGPHPGRETPPEATQNATGASATALPASEPTAETAPDGNREADSASTGPDAVLLAPVQPPHRLSHFFRRLAAIEAGEEGARARVLHFGDSHTASDHVSGRLRELFWERFGDGGRGYILAGHPWEGYRQEYADYDMTGDWDTNTGLRSRSPGVYGMGGARIDTVTEDASFERAACDDCDWGDSFDRFSLHFLRQPDGGSFDVLIDGVLVDTFNSQYEHEEASIVSWDLEDAPHHIRVRAHGDGIVSFFGTAADRSGGGFTWESIGINGAQLKQFLRFDDELVQAEIAARSPDLIVVAFGTNEAVSNRYSVDDMVADADEFESEMQRYTEQTVEFLERALEASPDASCLVLLPPDFAPSSTADRCDDHGFDDLEPACIRPALENLAGISQALRDAAEAVGCEAWDQQRAMGGSGGIHVWSLLSLARGDGVHLRRRGYDRLTEQLYADLIEAYEAWMLGVYQPLRTTVIYPEYATTADPDDDGVQLHTPPTR